MTKLRQYILMTVLAVLFISACSKSEEAEETFLTMKGSLTNDVPSYVMVDEYVTLTASGIVDPAEPVYKWYATEITSDTIISSTVTLHFPDEIGMYQVSSYSSYPGYYTNSNTIDVTTVDTTYNGSLTNVPRSGKSVIDARDHKQYSYVTVGNLDWFSQNLAYAGAGVPYMKSPATGSFFGYYYFWNEATGGESAEGLGQGPQGVCPEGWSIPTNEDWEDLASAMSGENLPFNDKWEGLGEMASVEACFMDVELWEYSKENRHTNDFGWNALPTGNTRYSHTAFEGFDYYGYWWSATQKNDKQAYYRYIHYSLGNFPMNFTAKEDFGASVRCVRLAE